MTFTANLLRRAAQKPGEVAEEGDTERDNFRGLPVVIENRKGTIREGEDPSGHHWEIEMKCDYGYIPNTEAAGDKEGLDVFIGDDEFSEWAFAVEQTKDDGEFDEYKIVLGAPDLKTAEELYLSNYEDGWGDKHVAEIWEIPISLLFDGVKKNQEEVGTEKNAKVASLKQVIQEFLDQYKVEQYERVAEEVHDELEDLLLTQNVRALVTCRAKRVDSLRRKLETRDVAQAYETLEQIKEDIKDLAGVRVALYFPGDAAKVDFLIQSEFQQARPPKQFPKDRDPGEIEGYRATHYTIVYDSMLVEIQVASMLIHAMAEAFHDVMYKPLNGAPTSQENLMMESLYELVSQGEAGLDDLRGEMETRMSRPLQMAMTSSLNRQLANARYYTNGLKQADELDDELKSLWKERNIQPAPTPDTADNKYLIQALRQVVPDVTDVTTLPDDIQRVVWSLAQKLKEEAQN